MNRARTAVWAAAVAFVLVCGCSFEIFYTASGADGGGADTAMPDGGGCDPATFEPSCSDPDTLQECVGGIPTLTPCARGCTEVISNAYCNECTPGASPVCEAGGQWLDTCDTLGRSGIEACLDGCVPGSAVCDPCTPNTTMCIAGQLVTCDASGNQTSDDCLGNGCGADGTQTCNECMPSTDTCLGSMVITCDTMGDVIGVENCPMGCNATNPTMARCDDCMPSVDFCAPDGNVHACDPDGTEGVLVETCTTGCSAGACNPATFNPSNVDPAVITTAMGMGLGDFGTAFSGAGGVSGDEVVVNTDTGSIKLFRDGSSETFIRSAGTGLDNGIYFQTQAQPTAPVDAGVFVMADFDVPANVRLRGIGTDALIIVATGCATIVGDVLVGGGRYEISAGAPFDLDVDDGTAGDLNVPGPGGFAGGARDGGSAAEMGGGPGGGTGGDDPNGDYHGGGGGGGHGGEGGDGGDSTNNGNPGALGGEDYYCGGAMGTNVCTGGATDFNALLIPLVGGSGGGGGGENGDSGEGRSGGGAVQITALGAGCGVTVTGFIDAGGEGGDEAGANNRSGGGGGAGGAILLEGWDVTVTVSGRLTANGGGGGAGRGCGFDGDRGHLDSTPAPGGTLDTGCAGAPGGDGGADTSLDGSTGGTDNRDPGGGGGAVGRIRINGFTRSVASATVSPAIGTSAYSEGAVP